MLTIEDLKGLPIGTPIELLRGSYHTLRFVKTKQNQWLREEDGLTFESKDFIGYVERVRLLPLEMLAMLAEENK